MSTAVVEPTASVSVTDLPSREPSTRTGDGAAGPAYRGLRVWQRAVELAVEIHAVTRGFPRAEQAGLAAELRRAAAAVATNIAEGSTRHAAAEYGHHLGVALGAVAAVETQLHLAIRLGLVDDASAAPALALGGDITRMIRALGKAVRTPSRGGSRGQSRGE